jgi:hypothetical protein
MKKFTIVIYSSDTSNILSETIQLFIKNLRMRCMIFKASFIIEKTDEK